MGRARRGWTLICNSSACEQIHNGDPAHFLTVSSLFVEKHVSPRPFTRCSSPKMRRGLRDHWSPRRGKLTPAADSCRRHLDVAGRRRQATQAHAEAKGIGCLVHLALRVEAVVRRIRGRSERPGNGGPWQMRTSADSVSGPGRCLARHQTAGRAEPHRGGIVPRAPSAVVSILSLSPVRPPAAFFRQLAQALAQRLRLRRRSLLIVDEALQPLRQPPG